MVYDLMNTGCAEDGEPSNVAAHIPAAQFFPVSPLSSPLYREISLPVLAAQCLRELDHSRRGEPCTDAYGLELLRRAIRQSDQEAWAWVQHCFGGMVQGWLRRHPQREVACRLQSEEHYVAQTFERFWQAAIHTQEGAICSLAVALRFLQASLNGALLETLRAYSGPGESSISDPYEAEERIKQKMVTGSEVWAVIQDILHDAREQRLASLLFHCGLSPREVLRCCPREFDDLREISHLRYTILEHLLHHADQFPWRLSEDDMSAQVDDEVGGEVGVETE